MVTLARATTGLIEPGAPPWAQRMGLRLSAAFLGLWPTAPVRLWRTPDAALPPPEDWPGSVAVADGILKWSDGSTWTPAGGGGGGGVPEAPNDGQRYARGSLGWFPTVSFPEAPNDGAFYARRNLNWSAVVSFPEAPVDGQYYSRRNGAWAVPPAVSGGTTILDGAGPPANALGAAGNYYLDTTAKWLYGPRAAGFGAAVSAFGPPPAATNATDVASNFSLGRQYTCVVAGRITGVRAWRGTGGAAISTRQVRLYTSAGVLLGSANTAGEVNGAWAVGTFGAPIDVTAGQVVRAVFDLPGGVAYGFTTGAATSLTPLLTPGSSYNLAGLGNFPTTVAANSYWADLLFEPGPWPIALKSA